ncbi:MAG TPA: aminoacyl-tRNA hydrolase [Vicinamibacterales bacterium]|jgi:peptidyl-tRNA hydrolase, PTH1 family|nr:aminoacyl-tRNA hydrolase [Vicinamibacterales bacterium]
MKLVVGLGNPGRQYAGTRHNVGFDAVDLLAGRHALSWEAAPRGIDALSTRWNLAGTLVAKPLTFMNRSGEAIVGLLQFYKIEVPDLLVIVDEIQLEAGRIRLRPSGSAGGHNGLKSIIQSLGTDAFPRLRIGIGRGDAQRDLADHVLSRVEPAERPVIEEAIGRAADAAELFVAEGIMPAMNRFNRKDDEVQQ